MERQPDLQVSGEVVEWRGPAPFHFLVIRGEEAEFLTDIRAQVTYGWGMVPVSGLIGDTHFTTSLWPRGSAYYLPLKDAVRSAEGFALGETVTVALWITG